MHRARFEQILHTYPRRDPPSVAVLHRSGQVQHAERVLRTPDGHPDLRAVCLPGGLHAAWRGDGVVKGLVVALARVQVDAAR